MATRRRADLARWRGRPAWERASERRVPLEVDLAERVRQLVPSMERVRFVSSGTEATMSAVRVARGATGRDKIVKFEGCYHGHADAFLVQAGSGALTFGTPTSPGVPAGAVADTLLARFNDLDSVERARRGQSTADCGHHDRAGRRQHGHGAARAWIPAKAFVPSVTGWARC